MNGEYALGEIDSDGDNGRELPLPNNEWADERSHFPSLYLEPHTAATLIA